MKLYIVEEERWFEYTNILYISLDQNKAEEIFNKLPKEPQVQKSYYLTECNLDAEEKDMESKTLLKIEGTLD